MWISLQTVIDDALRRAHHVSEGLGLRECAASLAVRSFGAPAVEDVPALVNVCALGWLMRDRRVIHRISEGVTRLVDATDLRTLPGGPPTLLRGPCILTVRNPERGACLFGDTAELGCYPLDGRIYFVGLQYPDGIRVAGWRPQWSTKEVEVKPGGSADFISDVDAWQDWTRQAVRFALLLGLLLDAEGAPVIVDGRKGGHKAAGSTSGKPGSLWSARRVYIDAHVYRPSVDAGVSTPGNIPDHLRAVQSSVSGHLKRQAYGSGGKLRKWVYVQAYEARRWVAPGRATRVDVRMLEERG